MKLSRKLKDEIFLGLPTYAKKMQYKAANTGSGIEANIAPNFPA
jgi:hypothetical protein